MGRVGASVSQCDREAWRLWQELPSGNDCPSNPAVADFVFIYKAMIVINGSIYIADPDRQEIHLYDYESSSMPTLSTQPLISVSTSYPSIIYLVYESEALWVLTGGNTSSQWLIKYDWKTKTELVAYDLNLLEASISSAKWGGLAVAGRNFHLIKNDDDAGTFHFAEP